MSQTNSSNQSYAEEILEAASLTTNVFGKGHTHRSTGVS